MSATALEQKIMKQNLSKINPKSTKNRWKINQQSTQHRSKIEQTSTKNRPKSQLERKMSRTSSWEPSWRRLRGVLEASWSDLGRFLGGQDAPNTSQAGAKMGQDRVKTAQDGAKKCQDGATIPQDDAKTCQDGAPQIKKSLICHWFYKVF